MQAVKKKKKKHSEPGEKRLKSELISSVVFLSAATEEVILVDF